MASAQTKVIYGFPFAFRSKTSVANCKQERASLYKEEILVTL